MLLFFDLKDKTKEKLIISPLKREKELSLNEAKNIKSDNFTMSNRKKSDIEKLDSKLLFRIFRAPIIFSSTIERGDWGLKDSFKEY